MKRSRSAYNEKISKHKSSRYGGDDDSEDVEELPISRKYLGNEQRRDAFNSEDLHASASEDSQDLSDSSESDSDLEAEVGDAEEIPLGQLVQMKANGSTTPATMKARATVLSKSKPKFKRESKHKPAEMSSKRPVPVFRDVFQTGKRESRDPRFDALSGEKISNDRFKKRYAFMYDEQLPEERREIKEALKKVKSETKKVKLKEQLAAVTQQIRTEEQRRKKISVEKEIKAKHNEALKPGQKPYYLKKSEKRKLELVHKYEELKAKGELDKYMAKRRKRNAAKDHRYLPVGRRTADD